MISLNDDRKFSPYTSRNFYSDQKVLNLSSEVLWFRNKAKNRISKTTFGNAYDRLMKLPNLIWLVHPTLRT